MSRSIPSIDVLWSRLKSEEGNEFRTKTGLPFTYGIHNDTLRPSRTNYHIQKSDFQKALVLVPFEGPGVISHLVRGPAYVWAVLHDRRIRKNDW